MELETRDILYVTSFNTNINSYYLLGPAYLSL